MKINAENTEKLNAAIAEAEGRAKVRTVDAKTIQNILDRVSGVIPKAKLHGTKVYYDGAEHFPNAYKYRPESTHWTAENIKGKWYVTDIKRATCPNRRTWNTSVVFSEEAKEAIINICSYINY